jgi:thiol-disulfide isomerase/thioredoxin
MRVGLVIMLAAMLGCSVEQPGQEPAQLDDSQAQAADKEPRLRLMNWAGVEQLIASHRGKVVVVDLWSSSCLPCLREFPQLVQLSIQFPDDVACISVNLDYIGLADEPPESLQDPVAEFLEEQQAFFDNVLSSDTDDAVMEQVSAASIPVVMVYGRDGELLETFKNDDGTYGEEFTYQDHVRPRVKAAMDAADED